MTDTQFQPSTCKCILIIANKGDKITLVKPKKLCDAHKSLPESKLLESVLEHNRKNKNTTKSKRSRQSKNTQ